ncbi:AMP-binding protein, partial [Escherichia coli]
ITTNSLLSRIPQEQLPNLETIVIVDDEVDVKYVDFNKALATASTAFNIEWLDREDGLILHYTSGSTGQPKGVL